jgi:hypothetical protein
MEDSTLEYVILLISVIFGLFAVIKEMFFKPEIKYSGTGKNRVQIKPKRNWLYPILMFIAFGLIVYFGNELRVNHKMEKLDAETDNSNLHESISGLQSDLKDLKKKDSLILTSVQDTLVHHGYYLNQNLQLIQINKNVQPPLLNIYDNVNSTFHDINVIDNRK